LANHKSAIKRAKQNELRRIRNRARRTRMKHAIRGLEEALASHNHEEATSRLREAISVIDKTASKGVIHKNHASRKISRLTQKVNTLAPSA
jgi:small subunit ribosomal protein S20